MSAYTTLPGGDRIPPYQKRRMCGSLDFSSLQYREWAGPSVSGVRAFVFSERVPDGFYWWVTALSAMNSDPANARGITFHLIPSQATPDASFFLGAGNLGPTARSVRIDPGGGNSQNFTSVAGAKVPFAVPSGFFLLGYEEQAGNPVVGAHSYNLRAAFFQVANGSIAPGMC